MFFLNYLKLIWTTNQSQTQPFSSALETLLNIAAKSPNHYVQISLEYVLEGYLHVAIAWISIVQLSVNLQTPCRAWFSLRSIYFAHSAPRGILAQPVVSLEEVHFILVCHPLRCGRLVCGCPFYILVACKLRSRMLPWWWCFLLFLGATFADTVGESNQEWTQA